MPTLPEQLDELLASSNISTELQGQLGMIIDAADLLGNMIANPPTEIDDLLTGLSNISVTNIQLPENVSTGFSGLSNIIPEDLGSVTGNIDELLSGFSSMTELDVLDDIQSYINCLQGVAALLNVDFSQFNISIGEESSTTTSSSGGTTSTDAGGGSGGTGAATTDPGGSSTTGDASADAWEASSSSEAEPPNAVKQIDDILGTFPQPFNAQNVVIFLRDIFKGIPRDNFKMRRLPIYDDMFALLNSISQFDGMSPNQLQTHAMNTITSVTTAMQREGLAPINSLTSLVSTIETDLDLNQIKTQMEQMVTALSDIETAVTGADISGIDPQINVVNNQLDLLLPNLQALLDGGIIDTTNQLCRQTTQIHRQMDIAMRRLQGMLQAPNINQQFSNIESIIQQNISDSGIQKLSDDVKNYLQQISQALLLLESTTVKEALGAVSDVLDTALDEFDNALLQVATQVSALFDEVDNALAQIDTAEFKQQVVDAIAQVQDALEDAINELFAPVRDAITDAVNAIGTTVDSFDPDQVANVLRSVIQQITDVLTDPAVMDAIDQIRNTLDTVTNQIQTVSFDPVVDEIIKGIDEIKETLQSIDPAELNDIIKGAIKTAIGVLPEDLEEPRTWLTSELDRLIDEGPKPLVEKVKQPVAQLTDQITGMSPEKLIGDSLSGPFQSLISELDAFTPSNLLNPINDGLDDIKNQIGDQINLEALMQPLESLFEQLLSQFDRFGPEQIIEPIENQISALIDDFMELLPEEVVFEVLDSIISGIQTAAGFVADVKNLLLKIQSMLADLADPQAQLNSWMQPVLTAVDNMPAIPNVETLLTNLNQTVDQLKQNALITAIENSLESLRSALNTAQPQTLLTNLTTAYQNVDRSAIESLADSPQKTALLNLLDRFNPMQAPFNRVFNQLQTTNSCLQTQLAELSSSFEHWDQRFFTQDNPFSKLQVSELNMQSVKDLLKEGIEQHAIQPISQLLSSIIGMFSVFDGPIDELVSFVNDIEEMLTELTEGPDSLGEIRDTLSALVDRFKNINLQFLTDELNEVFDAVKQKLEDVSPTALRQELETAIDETLDAINIDLLLPEEEVNQIDQIYQDLIDKLNGIDPSKLVIDAVTPEYDEKIQPILKSFDLVEPIDALIQRMDDLGDELNQALARTDDSYKNMLQAVPV